MEQQERQFEIARLEKTLSQVHEQIKISEQTSESHQSNLRDTLQEYWKTGSSIDEAQIIDVMNRQRALTSHIHYTAEHLRKMLKSPYFGRVDFIESGFSEAEKIYIGIGSLSDNETGEFLVYDWRAPVSAMFYDFGRGQASYNCPAGTITGVITLKRQFKIVDGCIEYMFDSDLKIDDEILQQLLGKSADDKMHTIVNSIQREQNQIIRDQKHKVLFVEGPAGSGKTSVALHRIAFLLYQNRESLTSKNVLILSPNHIFSDYISNVLPEIGEENVVQMTFQDYVTLSNANIQLHFESRKDYLEEVLSNNVRKKRAVNISFKSSSPFMQALIKYLEWLSSEWVGEYPAIEFRGETIFRKEEWLHYYQESFAMMPPSIRLEKIRIILQNRMRDLVHTIRQEKVDQITAAGEEINEKIIKALARIEAREELRPLTEQIEQLTSFDIIAEYKRLFADDKLYSAVSNTTSPTDWQAIKTHTVKSVSRGILPFEDLPPFLYFLGVIQGFAVNKDIKHIVIDEAQDYTAFHYKILTRLFPNCSWTIVGDPVQSIQPFLSTVKFAEASEIIDQDHTLIFTLTKSYRATLEIQAFCQALLPGIHTEVAIRRKGQLPTVISVKDFEMLAEQINQTVQVILHAGWNSIGIITKNAVQATEVYELLKSLKNITLVTKEDDEYYSGVIVIPSYLAKGLEFDAVLVVNADAENYRRSQDRQILYTVCTRALHCLYIYYMGTPSHFLNEIDTKLYQKTEGI